MKSPFFARGQLSLCMNCRRRVESNGERFIHLVIYGNNVHPAEPNPHLVGDGNDVWFAEKLRLMETHEE